MKSRKLDFPYPPCIHCKKLYCNEIILVTVHRTSMLHVAKCSWYFLVLDSISEKFLKLLNGLSFLTHFFLWLLRHYISLVFFLLLWLLCSLLLFHSSWVRDHFGVYHSSVLVYLLSLNILFYCCDSWCPPAQGRSGPTFSKRLKVFFDTVLTQLLI